MCGPGRQADYSRDRTSAGERRDITAEPDEWVSAEVNGQITYVRIEGANGDSPKGVELELEPPAATDAAVRAKKLQVAAELERERTFEPLTIHAGTSGGRVRKDAAGIRAFRAGEPTDDPERAAIEGARFELADVPGADRAHIRLAKNAETNAVERAQVVRRSRSPNDVPLGITVGELVEAGSQKDRSLSVHSDDLEARPNITTSTTYTDELTGDLNTHTGKSYQTALHMATVKYQHDHVGTHGGFGDAIDDATDAAQDSADIVVESVQAGVSIGLTATGSFTDVNFEIGNFTGFSKQGVKAFNRAITSASPFTTAMMHFGEEGEVNSCSTCVAVGLVAIDVGVGKATTLGCTAITGGVGAMGCAVFFSVLADLVVQYAADTALERACGEAGFC